MAIMECSDKYLEIILKLMDIIYILVANKKTSGFSLF